MTLTCPLCRGSKFTKKRSAYLLKEGELFDSRGFPHTAEYENLFNRRGMSIFASNTGEVVVWLPSLECQEPTCGCIFPLTKSIDAQSNSKRPR